MPAARRHEPSAAPSPERRSTPHIEPPPQRTSVYSGIVDARRDAIFGRSDPPIPPRAIVPEVPAYLRTNAGMVHPPVDPASPARDREPTPQSRLPPLPLQRQSAVGQATAPSPSAAGEVAHPEAPSPGERTQEGGRSDAQDGDENQEQEAVATQEPNLAAVPIQVASGAAREAHGNSHAKVRRSAEPEGEQEQLEPLPNVEHGVLTLRRAGIEFGSDRPTFDAPLSLEVRPSKRAEKLEPELSNYVGLYAAAAAASRDLYSRIISQLSRLSQEAPAEADRAATLRQQDLDEGIRTVDEGLVRSRATLRLAFEDDLARLESAALAARRLINRAAASGIARLEARAKRVDADLKGKQGERGKIAAMPGEKGAELLAAAKAAEGGFKELKKAEVAETRLPVPPGESGEAMKAAQKDATVRDIAFPCDEVILEVKTISERLKESIDKQVAPTNRSLCMAFCPFENMKSALTGEGEHDGIGSVRKARTQSIRQLDKMHRQLRRKIARIRRDGERTLISQHRTQRKRLIGAGKDRRKLEQEQHSRQARVGTGMYSAAAAAQSAALSAIYQRIVDRAPLGEIPLATAAMEFSRGLLQNGVPRGRAQASAIEERAATAATSLTKMERAASRQFVDGAHASLTTFDDDLRSSDDAAASTVTEGGKAMAAIAQPIGETVDGFVRSVNQNFNAAMGSLDEQLGAIRTGLVNSFSGKSAKEKDEDKTNDKKGKSDAAACKDCPPAPAEEKKQKNGSTTGGDQAKSINDYIRQFNAEGQKPETNANITSYCDRTWREEARRLEERRRNLSSSLCYSDAAFYTVLDQLRGLTANEGRALEEIYNAKGKDLRKDLDWYLNAGNPASGITSRLEAIRAARAYLNGDVVSGARHELNVCVEWSNDSGQIDKVMMSLTPAQMNEMFERFPDELQEVQDDLNSLDSRVFERLKQHDVAGALALRGQAAIDEARDMHGYAGTDRTGDAINSIYRQAGSARLSGGPALETSESAQAREGRVAAEWTRVESAFADVVGRDYQHPVGGGTGETAPGDALINYATRGIAYEVNVPNDPDNPRAGTHRETRTDVVDVAQRRLITNIVRYHEGSPEVIAAQLAMEDRRPGGPNPDKVREAMQDPALNPALIVDGAPGGVEAARRRHNDAVKRQQRAMQLLDDYALADGVCRDRPSADIRSELADRFAARLHHDPERAEYVRSLILADPMNEDAFIDQTVTQLEYAMEGAGTNVGALTGALSQLTRDQYLRVKEEWRLRHGEDLDVRIGVPGHGNWLDRLVNSETSGETAQRMEVLTQGIPRTEEERIKIGALEMYQQIRDAGVLGPVVAAEEHAQLEEDYRKLLSNIGASSLTVDENGTLQFVDLNNEMTRLGVFDEHGALRPDAGVTAEELAVTIRFGKQSVANYIAATDRIADMIATALVVAAAIVTTALTGGAAASIWIPVLITAAAGVAAMGVKYAIKGGRYGSEEMMFDLASTIIQAATAGIGAAAGAALRGGSKAVGALATTWRMSEEALATAAAGGVAASKALPALTFGQELFVGALTAGFAGGANAAIAPDNWRSDDYASHILAGIVRGAIGGAIGAGTARSIGKLAGPLGEIPARGLASGVSGMASRMAELSFDDAVLGRRVTWSEMVDQSSTAFLQNLVQALGEGAADISMRNRYASRRAEHEWHEAHSPEAIQQREAALKRMAETELARRGALGGDKPPAEAPIPELQTAPVAPPHGMGIDEDGALIPHALMHDDEGGPLRTGERDEPAGRRTLPQPANDNPGGRPHQIMALSEFDMLTMPKAMEGAVFVHPDSTSLTAANDNFGRLIQADPTREVAIHYNPVTGEYVVIQGGPKSVAVIKPGGEMSGPGAGGRLVSERGVPSGEGYWIVRSHFHPNRPGETATALLRRLPSAFGGDFGVIHFESVGLGLGDRSSRIYFHDEGHVAYTDFGIAPGHPEGQYWIDFPHPQTGERVRRHFETPTDYGNFVKAAKANPESAVAPRGGGLHTADTDVPGGALRRGLGETELSPADRRSIRDLADEVQGLGEHRRAVEILRENGASQATIEAARRWVGEAEAATQSLVEQMGLVGEPQSMDRLHHIMNDTTMSPDLRQAIGEAVVAATREHMIRSGELGADEPLMLLFHGAPIGRARSMAEGGIDLARVGTGHGDDFGGGLYLTSGVANAEKYAAKFGQERGAIFPFVMRQRDMGLVVDVRPGGAHRAEWEAFVTQNYHLFAEGVMTPAMAEAMMAGRRPGFADLDGYGNRGEVFEAFLVHLSVTMGDPTLARPDLVMGELGGPFTTGVGTGDQQAARTGVVADVLNSQMGSRAVPAREQPEPAHPGALRHDDVEGVPASAADSDAAHQVEDDVERAFAATFDRSIEPETSLQARQSAAREETRSRAMSDAVEAAVRRFIAADGPDRATQVKARVLRKIMASAPEAAGAILRTLGSGTAEGGGRVLSTAQETGLVREMVAGGMPPALAERYARAFGRIADAGGPLHRAIATAVERAAWGDSLGGLQQRAEAALDRRLLLLAARQFAERISRESAGPRFKEIFRKDEGAVMGFLAGGAPMRERMDAFRRARRIAGATPEEVSRDVASLVSALRDGGLQETIDRWHQRYRESGITVDDLDRIVRDHPEALLMTARAAPDQLAEFMARRITELLPETQAGSRAIDSLEFVASFQRGQETGVKSLLSELEAVRMLAGVPVSRAETVDPAMTLLKSDAVNGGRTNRGGLDIVGFQTLPGGGANGEDLLQIVVVDDKAVNAETLDSVSALTGERLRINLLVAAHEIRRRVTSLPGAADPELHSFVQNSQRAAAEMLAAAGKLDKLTIPPATDEAATQAYHDAVARIMDEHHISLVVTSEYGSITRLKDWMTRQGIRTYPEYLRWLGRRQRGR